MLDDHFEGVPVLVYDLSVPLEERKPIEFPSHDTLPQQIISV